ncbi:MAG: hypothetical protein KF887_12410 [Paracoccaceae bacterium]|nr:MAG: hypothetical protein KF887_12410 [Paracoccaceae bacterium]
MTSRIFFEREAATFLTEELKVPVKTSTLAAKRMNGGGPTYRRVLGRIEYVEADLREWVDTLRAHRFTSTAQEPMIGGPKRKGMTP